MNAKNKSQTILKCNEYFYMTKSVIMRLQIFNFNLTWVYVNKNRIHNFNQIDPNNLKIS